MNMRTELEAALARAEAGWHHANDDHGKAQAYLITASAGWDSAVTDRRKTEVDRRKTNTTLDRFFPDRRKAGADRRFPVADVIALAQAVADRHKAHIGRSDAAANLARAEAELEAATAERVKASAALDELNHAQSKRQALSRSK